MARAQNVNPPFFFFAKVNTKKIQLVLLDWWGKRSFGRAGKRDGSHPHEGFMNINFQPIHE